MTAISVLLPLVAMQLALVAAMFLPQVEYSKGAQCEQDSGDRR